ncbi:hypothetical protein D3C75_645230 [compost metagenome]
MFGDQSTWVCSASARSCSTRSSGYWDMALMMAMPRWPASWAYRSRPSALEKSMITSTGWRSSRLSMAISSLPKISAGLSEVTPRQSAADLRSGLAEPRMTHCSAVASLSSRTEATDLPVRPKPINPTFNFHVLECLIVVVRIRILPGKMTARSMCCGWSGRTDRVPTITHAGAMGPRAGLAPRLRDGCDDCGTLRHSPRLTGAVAS